MELMGARIGLCSAAQGVLNSQYSYLQGRIACQLRAAITCTVFRKVGASQCGAGLDASHFC
jgi:hypothetical protein